MRTMLRLQNHGCRGHPFWWIVVQGSYTNLKGRFIEHVGYYLPRKGATVQRAAIFNKPRIRYWLAMGAQPSRAVHRILSYIDYMPKPRPAYGFNQMYEKKPKDYEKPKGPMRAGFGVLAAKHYDKYMEKTELNLVERELRAQYEMDKQVRLNEENDDVELVDSDIEDEKLRTKTFNTLRTKFIEMEKDVKKLNLRKREILFRKMNKLASKGILSDEAMKIEPDSETGEPNLYGVTKEERLDKQMKFIKLMEQKRIQYDKAIHNEQMLKPITQEDFVNYVYEHTNMSINKVQREASAFYAVCAKTGRYATKQDAWNLVQKYPKITFAAHEIHKLDRPELVIPTQYPITPFPDLTTFDPQSYYDTKLGPHQPDDPNKAYDSLRFKPLEKPGSYAHTYRRKQNKGRKTPVRITFSTTNTCSKRVPFCLQNLTVAYTGLMKKIASTW